MNISTNNDILAGFVEEVRSYLPRIRKGLELYARSPGEVEALEEAHRLAHSIKGASAMVGLAALSHTAYVTEETLAEIVSGQTVWSRQVEQCLHLALRSMEAYLQRLEEGQVDDRNLVDPVMRAFRRLWRQPESGDDAAIEALLPASARRTNESTPAVNAEPPADPAEGLRGRAEKAVIEASELLAGLSQTQDRAPVLAQVAQAARSLGEIAGSKEVAGTYLSQVPSVAGKIETLCDGMASHTIESSRETDGLLCDLLDLVAGMIAGEADPAIGETRQRLESRYEAARSSAAAPPAREPAHEPAEESSEAPAELIDVFREEVDEHLAAVVAGLRELETRPTDRRLLQEVRRRVHTIKGAAGVVGMHSLQSLAHRAEDLLDVIYEEDRPLTQQVRELLYATCDLFVDLIGDAPPSATEPALKQILARFDQALASPEPPAAEPPTPAMPPAMAPSAEFVEVSKEEPKQAVVPEPPLVEAAARETVEALPEPPPIEEAAAEPVEEIHAEEAGESAGHHEHHEYETAPADPSRRAAHYVRLPVDRLDELTRLVSDLVVTRSVFEQHLAAYAREVEELRQSTTRLRRLSAQMDSDFEVSALGGNTSPAAPPKAETRRTASHRAEFDSLELDRYTEVHLLSRDLAEATADVGAATTGLNGRIAEFEACLGRLGRVTSEMQDRMMRLRMVPLGSMKARFLRTVRVSAAQRAKAAELNIIGEEIELDKTLLEEIAAPIEHLLRNAVDHGIESEAFRRASGKAVCGRVTLECYHEAAYLVIAVGDDGAGIEPKLVRDAAIRHGQLTPSEAARLTDRQLIDLIFQPGLTTTAAVDEISGRGVGLDIVNDAVQRLKGTIRTETTTGRGTRFEIRLPISLALQRVLLVRASGETFAVPLAVVSKTFRADVADIDGSGESATISSPEGSLPFSRLADTLGLKATPDPTVDRPPVLVIRLAGKQQAIAVDHILQAREVVVKPMGHMLRQVKGVSGATLMGDGSVILILNPADLLRAEARVQAPPPPPEPIRPVKENYDVMVVDDSVSVRRVVANLVTKAGWNPYPAKDGLDALEQLHSGRVKPDVILLDIEMPRMDGYEFASTIRGTTQFSNLPVIMLTSRSGDKHRQKALDSGATDFLVKPYQEEVMLSAIRRAVGEARGVAIQ